MYICYWSYESWVTLDNELPSFHKHNLWIGKTIFFIIISVEVTSYWPVMTVYLYQTNSKFITSLVVLYTYKLYMLKERLNSKNETLKVPFCLIG